MKAIVYIRSNARKGNVEHAHVGWAFEVKPGIFNAGSIEDVPMNKRWNVKTNDPNDVFGCGPNNGYYPTYDMYKVLEVASPNIASALASQQQVMQTEYSFIGKNCMDATYKILHAYGAKLPVPADKWFTNDWFNNIDQPFKILWNSHHLIDFSLYEHPGCEGDSERYRTNEAQLVNGDLHVWGREIGDHVSSIVLRKGRLRIFEHQNFEGRYADLTKPGLYNLSDFNFEDIMSSFQAWK